MIVIVGLGNPGKKYKDTWHNIGFLVIDKFKEVNSFPEFKLSKPFTFSDKKVKGKKSNVLISEGFINSKKIILAKPQTFMNNSGQAIKTLINFHKTKDLFVVHDDIDLPLGKIKIAKGRSSAGHKGVESIIKEIGTKDFIRFRVGIQPEKAKPRSESKLYYGAKLGAGLVPHRNKVSGAGFVLQKFNKEEKKIVKEVIKKTAKAIELILKKGIEKAMNEYNK